MEETYFRLLVIFSLTKSRTEKGTHITPLNRLLSCQPSTTMKPLLPDASSMMWKSTSVPTSPPPPPFLPRLPYPPHLHGSWKSFLYYLQISGSSSAIGNIPSNNSYNLSSLPQSSWVLYYRGEARRSSHHQVFQCQTRSYNKLALQQVFIKLIKFLMVFITLVYFCTTTFSLRVVNLWLGATQSTIAKKYFLPCFCGILWIRSFAGQLLRSSDRIFCGLLIIGSSARSSSFCSLRIFRQGLSCLSMVQFLWSSDPLILCGLRIIRSFFRIFQLLQSSDLLIFYGLVSSAPDSSQLRENSCWLNSVRFWGESSYPYRQ